MSLQPFFGVWISPACLHGPRRKIGTNLLATYFPTPDWVWVEMIEPKMDGSRQNWNPIFTYGTSMKINQPIPTHSTPFCGSIGTPWVRYHMIPQWLDPGTWTPLAGTAGAVHISCSNSAGGGPAQALKVAEVVSGLENTRPRRGEAKWSTGAIYSLGLFGAAFLILINNCPQ